jgi:dCMP deaminase
MASQQDLDLAYMNMAYAAAALSKARRRRVGAILVTPSEGRFEGVNGTPSGFDNNCEAEIEDFEPTFASGGTPPNSWASISQKKVIRLITKPEVLHAESNAIMKVARSHASSIGGTMYCTLEPCLECAKLIIQAGIVRVVYSEEYPYPGHSGPVRPMGLALLERAKIQVDNLPLIRQNDDIVLKDEGYYNPNEDAWRGFRP